MSYAVGTGNTRRDSRRDVKFHKVYQFSAMQDDDIVG